MFESVWIAFLVTGLFMAVGAVVWGVRTRQFEEQDRARFLPLFGLSEAELDEPPTPKHGPSFFANLSIIFLGLGVLAVTLVLVVRNLGA